jgi:hypothetical protein
MGDYRRGFGFDIGFIHHLFTQLGTTSNYSTILNLHTLQITTAHAKSFPACCVFTSRSLVTAPNSGDSSVFAPKSTLNDGFLPTDSFLHWLPCRTDLVAPVVFFINPRCGLRRKHRSFSYANSFRGNLFTEPYPSRGHLFLLIKNLLPNNERRSVICFAAVA